VSEATTSLPTNWREARRLRAWELKQQGWEQRAIARALGVSEGAVCQWMSRARAGGVAALRRRPPPGAPPKLTAEQRAALPAVLAQGAEYHGFLGEVWTGGRVAAVIRRVYGVQYHPAHVSRLLRRIGWSAQKPIRRASQRDEAAIERWRTERWPLIKKGRPSKAARSSG
jgi:transposase